MLEEMGITPDKTVREKKPSLKTLGVAAIATIRMQRLANSWTGSKQLQDSLLGKLESLKRSKGKGTRTAA